MEISPILVPSGSRTSCCGVPVTRASAKAFSASARAVSYALVMAPAGLRPVLDPGPLLARTRHLRGERGATGPVSYALQTVHHTRNRRPKPRLTPACSFRDEWTRPHPRPF